MWNSYEFASLPVMRFRHLLENDVAEHGQHKQPIESTQTAV